MTNKMLWVVALAMPLCTTRHAQNSHLLPQARQTTSPRKLLILADGGTGLLVVDPSRPQLPMEGEES